MLVDTSDGRLQAAGSTLRVRADGDRAYLTYKGPVIPGPFKMREEIETEAGASGPLLAILAALGFTPVFRSEKYREEFAAGGAVIAIDDTPIGAFVEIEGEAAAIVTLAGQLGFEPADFVLASYRVLFAAAGPAGAPADTLFVDADRT